MGNNKKIAQKGCDQKTKKISRHTSAKVASEAAKLLRDKRCARRVRAVAASALSQARKV